MSFDKPNQFGFDVPYKGRDDTMPVTEGIMMKLKRFENNPIFAPIRLRHGKMPA